MRLLCVYSVICQACILMENLNANVNLKKQRYTITWYEFPSSSIFWSRSPKGQCEIIDFPAQTMNHCISIREIILGLQNIKAKTKTKNFFEMLIFSYAKTEF